MKGTSSLFFTLLRWRKIFSKRAINGVLASRTGRDSVDNGRAFLVIIQEQSRFISSLPQIAIAKVSPSSSQHIPWVCVRYPNFIVHLPPSKSFHPPSSNLSPHDPTFFLSSRLVYFHTHTAITIRSLPPSSPPVDLLSLRRCLSSESFLTHLSLPSKCADPFLIKVIAVAPFQIL